MAFKIDESSLLERKALEVHDSGIKLIQTTGFGGAATHKFSEVVCVLMSPDYKLSVQVGQKVFTIQTTPGKPAHEGAIEALLQGLNAFPPGP